jgi:metal-sulfur cluster biosynthetic enzyme
MDDPNRPPTGLLNETISTPAPSGSAAANQASDGLDALALESEIREALRRVVDPEIHLDVIALGLIRNVLIQPDETEIQMILTTPFCPYAGSMVQQVKDTTRLVVNGPVRVTLLDDPWSPDLMEHADLAEWGLM